MLVRLTSQQVSENWEVVLTAIQRSFPPTQKFNSDVNERLLRAVLEGRLIVWVYVRNKIVVAIITTTISEDFCTGERNLLVFSLYSVGTISKEEWKSGIDYLKAHARSIACTSVIGYTKLEGLAKVLAHEVGADNSWTLLKMEV